MIRVLFVCLGNICRSPMAEAVFQHKVNAAGLQHEIEADSAGTGSWHIGAPPHRGTRGILDANHVPYSHAGRQLSQSDYTSFDYILTMDEQNYEDVQAMGRGTAQIVRFLDYAPEVGVREVPDPYHSGGFEGVYSMVDAASEGLLAAIRRDHNL